MQHCQRRNFPAVIQCVPQHLPVLLSLLLLPLFLSLPPRLLGKGLLSGVTDEALRSPLHFV
ncbi:hypothetical protein E2C01_027771 [Portunus trituberculatus]|uniref:Uncharacterized protein n=1 Tax=Portunus trituberculatus TaxID=210409 RepID=A0A5B7ELS6_PORTR|nr:hypothetical protein [Portunus trituberculatus]